MGKRVKRGSTKNKQKKKSSEKNESVSQPAESLDELTRQREEIQALLSSLEDAYSEATIMEEDYNDIKDKNTKRLEDIEKKIEFIQSKSPSVTPPPTEIPETKPPEVIPAAITPPVVVEEKADKKEKPEKGVLDSKDLKKLEVDLADKIKEMVDKIGTKVSEKDVLEIKTKFAKFDTDIEKLKALVDTIREGRKISDEKIQRIVEGLAEIRTMVYGREASTKEQEIKFEKMMDVINRLEPEKLIMELGKRDKEISNQKLRMDRMEETSTEFGEMLKRIEKLLRDIGSLENVVNVSNEASEKLMIMQTIERNNQKMLDKIQGLYAELSKRMEEFMLYRAKQDRMDDLFNEFMKSVDDINTKIAYFVTKDDLESFRASMKAVAPAAPGAQAGGVSDLQAQKDEIQMLLKSLEEESKSGAIPKQEFEKMKNANIAKLEELDKKIEQEGQKAPEPAPEEKKPEIEEVKKVEEKPKEEKKRSPEKKQKDDMLLKDLEDTFKKGFISKEAYEKTKKMILGKGE